MNKGDQTVETVMKSVRSAGFKTSIVHFRRVSQPYKIITPAGKLEVNIPVDMPLFEIRRRGLTKNILAKGGYTTARIWGNNIDVVAESRCNDQFDVFCNRLGSTKAFFAAHALLQKSSLTSENSKSPV
jgi:hypothetical protein